MNYDTEAFKTKLVEDSSNSLISLHLRFNLNNVGKASLKMCHEASMNTRISPLNSEITGEKSSPPIWDESPQSIRTTPSPPPPPPPKKKEEKSYVS